MLPRARRLNLSKSFVWVSLGQRAKTLNFSLRFRIGQNSDPLIGVAVSAKRFRRAIDRNRAKRISFQAIEPIYSLLQRGLNLVIMPKSTIIKSDLAQLTKELKDVFFDS